MAILLPLVVFPARFYEESLNSWLSYQVLRYFSFKIIFEEFLSKGKPRIVVGPPHGLFPFGDLCMMLSYPAVMGYSIRGVASSVALVVPIFKQILSAIGIVDASRDSLLAVLKQDLTVGISSGGVAEVFETNSSSDTEVIILKNRKGFVKLAFMTGADIVPSYSFGNTAMYSLWTGGRIQSILEYFSRRIGFAVVPFWGRFFLPVPYRVPTLCVMGKSLPVDLNPNPTEAEIDEVHEKLIVSMIALFDKYKYAYGWGNKRLIIK